MTALGLYCTHSLFNMIPGLFQGPWPKLGKNDWEELMT